MLAFFVVILPVIPHRHTGLLRAEAAKPLKYLRKRCADGPAHQIFSRKIFPQLRKRPLIPMKNACIGIYQGTVHIK